MQKSPAEVFDAVCHNEEMQLSYRLFTPKLGEDTYLSEIPAFPSLPCLLRSDFVRREDVVSPV